MAYDFQGEAHRVAALPVDRAAETSLINHRLAVQAALVHAYDAGGREALAGAVAAVEAAAGCNERNAFIASTAAVLLAAIPGDCRPIHDGIVDEAVALADALEKRGVAPWQSAKGPQS